MTQRQLNQKVSDICSLYMAYLLFGQGLDKATCRKRIKVLRKQAVQYGLTFPPFPRNLYA